MKKANSTLKFFPHCCMISINKIKKIRKKKTYSITILRPRWKQSCFFKAQKTDSIAATSVIVWSLSVTISSDSFPWACLLSSWYKTLEQEFTSFFRSWYRCRTSVRHLSYIGSFVISSCNILVFEVVFKPFNLTYSSRENSVARCHHGLIIK